MRLLASGRPSCPRKTSSFAVTGLSRTRQSGYRSDTGLLAEGEQHYEVVRRSSLRPVAEEHSLSHWNRPHAE